MNPQKKYPTTQKAQDFLKSMEGISTYEALMEMVSDKNYNTKATYSPNSENGNLLFIDKHMNYLCLHLSVNPVQYVSNLRMITKVRK